DGAVARRLEVAGRPGPWDHLVDPPLDEDADRVAPYERNLGEPIGAHERGRVRVLEQAFPHEVSRLVLLAGQADLVRRRVHIAWIVARRGTEPLEIAVYHAADRPRL